MYVKLQNPKLIFFIFYRCLNSEINPVVPSKILKRVVLPFAFYSYEIWPSLTIYDIQMLEYTQRFSSRIFQGLGFSKFSSSLSSISIIGLWTIQVHIDKYQLYFLSRFHWSDQTFLCNQVFRFKSDVHVILKSFCFVFKTVINC